MLKTLFKGILILTIIRNIFNLINFFNGTITVSKLITGCFIDITIILITYIMLVKYKRI